MWHFPFQRMKNVRAASSRALGPTSAFPEVGFATEVRTVRTDQTSSRTVRRATLPDRASRTTSSVPRRTNACTSQFNFYT